MNEPSQGPTRRTYGGDGARARIVVLGGGFGGLETAFALRLAVGDRARITLVSDRDHFLFKPNTIYIPFGMDPAKLRIPLERPTARRQIDFIPTGVEEVDPDGHAILAAGRRIPYDFLVIATGADMRAEEVPGLSEHCLSPWTPDDMVALRSAFEALVSEAWNGRRRRVTFLIPPNNKCAGPLYEIVLMLETWLRRRRARDHIAITWATCEDSYIQAFGPRLHNVVREEFERRGITGFSGYQVQRVLPGAVEFANGEAIEHDLLVAFPPYVARRAFPGLAADERGFLATELETRRAVGHPEIFVAGDAGDFPVKQAFLAFLQADAIADGIAAEVLGRAAVQPFDPVSMCVMEQFDKATFAKVPLRLTGNPAHPVEVRPDADGAYRVGSSRVWRAGKRVLGTSVPARFRAGLPFHDGAFWTGMDAGLRVMSKVLAD